MMSVANIVIFPMQDILGLSERARMNTPSTTNDNWQWRVTIRDLTKDLQTKLSGITYTYGRST